MNRTLAFLVLISLTSLVGCHSANRLGDPAYLPDNWLEVRSSSWQLMELPKTSQDQLSKMHARLTLERRGQYYSFFGNYKPETLEYMKSTLAQLDQDYLNLRYSAKAILANMTPEMSTLSQTYSERTARISVTNNQNSRLFNDDWDKALLLDKPSTLSIIPVVEH